jgi:uncharacterized protein (TIGR02246 family)
MTELQALTDRIAIEALRAEFPDAIMTRDFDRFASLFTEDGVWSIPYINVETVGREKIRSWVQRAQETVWEYFVQTTHPGPIDLDGDTAVGRAYILEFGRQRDGSSHLNYALYHDRYERSADGWKFAERVFEVKYADSSPLAGQGGTDANKPVANNASTKEGA